MKLGEKTALCVVGAVLLGILLLTVYMETQVRHNFKNSRVILSSTPTSLPDDDADNVALTVIPHDVNPAELPDANGRGATLFIIYCMQCHDLPNPTMHTSQEWKTVLARMVRQIQNRHGMMARVAMPSAKDWDTIQMYLSQHAQRALNAAALNDLDTPEGRAFLTTCSQCHAAPDPGQHTAKEWPVVVVRMKYHMRDSGKSIPDDENTVRIVTFLKRHGA